MDFQNFRISGNTMGAQILNVISIQMVERHSVFKWLVEKMAAILSKNIQNQNIATILKWQPFC